MLDLSVSEYNRFQADGLLGLSMCAIWAFSPAHFALTGYPSTIQSERELTRFIDSMSTGALDHIMSFYLEDAITEEEFTTVQKVAAKLHGFMESRYKGAAFPTGTLLRTLNVQRHLRYLYPDQTPSVLELGPGGGILGALLMHLGHAYAGTDVTQGYYILQNHLWNYLSDGKLRELAGTPGQDISAQVGSPVHIPWWEYARLRQDTAPQFDVITCNHVLCEMHNWSMRFGLSLGRSVLSGTDKPQLVVFENWGSYQAVGRKEFCEEAFEHFGYKPIFNDKLINVYLAPNSSAVNIAEMHDRIVEGRKKDQEKRIVTQRDIEAYFSRLTGVEKNLSEDDKFLEFIGGSEHGFPILFEVWPKIADERLPNVEMVTAELSTQVGSLAKATVQIYREVERMNGRPLDKPSN